jgi:lipoprotein-releasing system ATP-binding protein
MMPMLVDHGFQTEQAEARANELIRRVGLTHVAHHRSNDMSGGQQQRVAIARGLAMNPDILLADEPTGNLDTESTKSIFELMREVNRTSGTSILLITHNHDLGRQCDRIIQVVDGRIVT